MPSNSIECGDARITRVLHAMLTELADPLMRAGITPRLFGDLAAHAFVKAACKAATLRNGRINQSRVAVLTGLSRAEVRNVLRGARSTKARFQPRTQRVVDGWLSDTRYLVHGAPRPLPFNGPGASFATLVKKYAGDVPHHAVLEELRRLKLVKEGQETLRLVTPVMSASRAFQKSLHLLLALLSDGVAVAGASSAHSARGLHRLTLKAADARDSIALYQRALTSTASFVSGLDQSLQSAPTRKPKKGGSHITVSVLVRLKEPDSKTRRQRNVPTRD
jgi:hypothetical protein